MMRKTWFNKEWADAAFFTAGVLKEHSRFCAFIIRVTKAALQRLERLAKIIDQLSTSAEVSGYDVQRFQELMAQREA